MNKVVCFDGFENPIHPCCKLFVLSTIIDAVIAIFRYKEPPAKAHQLHLYSFIRREEGLVTALQGPYPGPSLLNIIMAETLTLRGTLTGHSGWVTAIAPPLDPTSDVLLSASR